MKIKLFPLILIILAASSRLLPHPPNFAPISAIVIFSAVYLPKPYSLFVPLTAMFLSDLTIGFYGPLMIFVYFSFAVSSIIGSLIKKRPSAKHISFASLAASVQFFLITNFAVWALPGSPYPTSFSGLLQSYTLAIPFFRNTLLGDLFFTFSLFYCYSFTQAIRARFATNIART